MKHFLDKGGALGALLVAVAAPCCFPLLAPLGFALGFGALLPWAAYALYGVAGCAAVAMVGSIVAFRTHRHLGWLLFGVSSGFLVLPALAFPWPPSLAYAGLLGLAVAAVANQVLVHREACSVTPRSIAQRPAEKIEVGSRSERGSQERGRMQERQTKSRKSIAERLSSAGLNPQEETVRKAILLAFADEGHAPSVQDLARTLGLPLASVLTACRTLAAADLVVWQDEEAHIVSAYPFSGSQTAHEVLLAGHTRRYAMCAIDALGMPSMLGQAARIRSRCFFCHTPVSVNMAEGLLQEASPSTLAVWLSEQDGCCVAEVCCPVMNFFCEDAHLQAWHTTTPQERGRSLTVLEALEVGRAAFGALLT